MPSRRDLIQAVKARYQAIEALGSSLEEFIASPEFEAVIDQYLGVLGDKDSIRELTGLDPDNPEDLRQLRMEMREELVREIFNAVQSRTTALQDAQAERAAQYDDESIVGYVYLGPDDMSNRPFCNALEFKWLTMAEIQQLDNGQLPDAYLTRGGYNCRHGWYALWPGEEAEYQRASVAEANAAARRK